VISTKFIGDNSAVDFWVARMLGELARWASRHPSSALQGVLFLDEADIYLPAQSKPATKEPLLDLLKRGRSAGLGVFLATQSPGDLDYRCRDNIRSWFVGRVAEKTAVDKMKPLLSESRINIGSKLALAKTGEFFRLEEGEVLEFKAALSLLSTSQLPEDEILKLAASGARASASGRVAKR
jgi:DNA helicase HerA-like ATPase